MLKYWLQYKSATHVYTKAFDTPLARSLFMIMLSTYGDMAVVMTWDVEEKYCVEGETDIVQRIN